MGVKRVANRGPELIERSTPTQTRPASRRSLVTRVSAKPPCGVVLDATAPSGRRFTVLGMAQLGPAERARLPDSAFAYIDAHGRRRLPIHDAGHVRNALARFNQVAFEDDAARDRARGRLLRAASRHGIMPVGFIDAQLRPDARLPTGRITFLLIDIEG